MCGEGEVGVGGGRWWREAEEGGGGEGGRREMEEEESVGRVRYKSREVWEGWGEG